MFTPIWGRFPFWLIFFQMGWNHQLVNNSRKTTILLVLTSRALTAECSFALTNTHPKFNVAEENWWLESYFLFWMMIFQGRAVKLRECNVCFPNKKWFSIFCSFQVDKMVMISMCNCCWAQASILSYRTVVFVCVCVCFWWMGRDSYPSWVHEPASLIIPSFELSWSWGMLGTLKGSQPLPGRPKVCVPLLVKMSLI